jgi:hypothetical protein
MYASVGGEGAAEEVWWIAPTAFVAVIRDGDLSTRDLVLISYGLAERGTTLRGASDRLIHAHTVRSASGERVRRAGAPRSGLASLLV